MRKNQEKTDGPKSRKLDPDIDSFDEERDLTVVINRLNAPFWSDRVIKAAYTKPASEEKPTEQK